MSDDKLKASTKNITNKANIYIFVPSHIHTIQIYDMYSYDIVNFCREKCS